MRITALPASCLWYFTMQQTPPPPPPLSFPPSGLPLPKMKRPPCLEAVAAAASTATCSCDQCGLESCRIILLRCLSEKRQVSCSHAAVLLAASCWLLLLLEHINCLVACMLQQLVSTGSLCEPCLHYALLSTNSYLGALL